MTDSHRVPGYPMRYVGAKKLDEDAMENAHKLDVHQQGDPTIPTREAKKSDVQRTPARKPTSLF